MERVAYWVAVLDDDDAPVVAFAAAMLGRIANAETDLSKLIEKLEDPDVHVRANAAAAVGSIGGETLLRSVGALVLLLQDDDGDVVANAAMALAQVNPNVPAEHLAMLIDALREGPVRVKDPCATAIAKFGAEIPLGNLRTLLDLLKDDDARVRSRCAKVLGKMGAPAAEGIIKVLASGSQDAKITAANALVQIDATLLNPYIEELIKALDESIQVRFPCAEMLGKMGSAAEERLIDKLEKGTVNARAGAAMALARIDPNVSDAYVPNLVRGLDDDSSLVRTSCRRALANVGASAALDLMNALERSETKHRLEVLDSLIEISPRPAAIISVLLEALQDEDTNVRLRAVRVLRDAGSNSRVTANALLDRLKNDRDFRVRLHALRALVRLGPDVHGRSSALITALADDAAAVRLGVIDSMIESGIPDPEEEVAVQAVIERLEDDKRDVRMRAMDVIQAIKTVDDSVPILAYAMTTRYHDVRRRAGSLLVEIGADANESMPQLVEALARTLTSDRDYVVRSLAARALGNLGPAAATAAASLTTASKDPAPGVSTNAIRALRIISAH